MINLLKANFTRLHKNKSFFLLLLFSTLFAYYAKLMSYDSKELTEYLFVFSLVSGIVIAVFTNSFIGLDYSDGAIRNKIVIGNKRINIYFANLITSVISVSIFYGMYVLVVLPLAFQNGAKIAISSKIFMKYLGSLFISFISYACIFNFISMNISNRVVAAIVNISLAILLIFIPFKCSETVSIYHNYFYAKTEDNANIIVSSYNRPSKEAMQISQVILDITPCGHMLQIDDNASYSTKPPVLFLYTLGTNFLITSLGIFIFNHKELK